MDQVSQIAANPGSLATEKATGGEVLGKNDFLKLLITQLKNQDPLNPSDPLKFTSQLAQYSSLEQLFSMNDQLEGLKAFNSKIDRLSSLSMIDKQVIMNKSSFQYKGDEVQLGYQLEEGVQQVKVLVQNSSGETVAHIQASETSPGEHFLTWDGRTDAGSKVPGGKYSFSVIASSGERSDPRHPDTVIKAQVQGVDYGEKGDTLITDAGNFSLSEVQRISK